MFPITFEQQTNTLHPSGKTYSENVESVKSLPIWSDGEQCVSCWRFSWRERFSILLFGRMWTQVLSGDRQPPIAFIVGRKFFGDA